MYQPNPQTTPVNATPVRRGIAFDRSFLFSIPGLISVALIIVLLAGIIAIAATPKPAYINDRTATENAYLVFACIGFILEIFFFTILILSLTSTRWFSWIPLPLVFAVRDLIIGIALFGLSISCAVLEANDRITWYFNKGGFGAAAFFGFFATILYLGHAILCIIELIRGRRSSYAT